MAEIFCLDSYYSTMRLVSTEKPLIQSKAEDKFETILFLSDREGRKGVGGLRTKGYFKKSFNNKPLVTVITVIFNGEKHLEETIQSVLNQTYDNVEYILIDGGSVDGTLDIIQKYQDKIDYWVSESDNGIYDAMNKGITVATGDIICILNSDDMLFPNAIKYAVNNFLTKDIDFYFAPVFFKQGLVTGYRPEKIKYGLDYVATAHSGGFFVKKSVHKKYGLYDCKFKTSADYDLILRIIQGGCKGYGGRESELGGIFRPGGHSGKRGFMEGRIEETKIRLNNKQSLSDIAIFLLISTPIQLSSKAFRFIVRIMFAWYKKW